MRRNNGGPGGISADWFNNNFGNLTVGYRFWGIPGAVGVQFYSNNVGAIRNMVDSSRATGQGVIGLDLGYDDQNGPMLARNITVTGFDTGYPHGGIGQQSDAGKHYDQHCPNVVGIRNDGQCVVDSDADLYRRRHGDREQWFPDHH